MLQRLGGRTIGDGTPDWAKMGSDGQHNSRKAGKASSLLALFGLVSVALHALLLFACAGFSWAIALPKVPLVWLDLDNSLFEVSPQHVAQKQPTQPNKALIEKKQPRPPARTTRRKPQPSAAWPLARRKIPKRRAPLPPKLAPLSSTTAASVDLDGLLPGHAALSLLIRSDRLRGSVYAQSTRHLLAVFYDHKTLLAESGLDPLVDFDALLIATPNPYRIRRTLLAGRFRGSARRIRAALGQSRTRGEGHFHWAKQPMGWLGKIPSPPLLPGDLRQVLLRDGLLLLGRPEVLRSIFAAKAPIPSIRGSGRAGGAGVRPLDRLLLLDREGGRGAKGPALMLQADRLERLVVWPPAWPCPKTLRVTVSADTPARVVARAELPNRGSVQRFLRLAKLELARLRRSAWLRVFGYGELLAALSASLEARGMAVEASAALAAPQINGLLATLAGLIPQVPLKSALPAAQPRKSRP